MLFDFLKKKPIKDQYLEKVADILHSTMGPMLPLKNAYNLSAECLRELRNNISKGVFHDGPNPRETLMAYYSLCSMVHESGLKDDKMTLLKITIMAQVLIKELADQGDLSLLEKGICQFGQQVLSEDSHLHSIEDPVEIKLSTVTIIMNLMKEHGASVSQDDVSNIVENVASNVGDKEICKVGEKVLALSVLSNATGYFIDQGDIQTATKYFMCIGAAIRKYFEGQMESFSTHQSSALRSIMEDYSSLAKELMEAQNS